MHNKYLKLTLILLGLVTAPFAHASFLCTGAVGFLGMGRDGEVFVSNGFGVWGVCSVANATNGLTADTCRAWYAAMISAQKAGGRVRIYFNSADGPENGSQCAAVGSWIITDSSLYFVDFLAN